MFTPENTPMRPVEQYRWKKGSRMFSVYLVKGNRIQEIICYQPRKLHEALYVITDPAYDHEQIDTIRKIFWEESEPILQFKTDDDDIVLLKHPDLPLN